MTSRPTMSRRDPDADLDLDELARRAVDGDREALSELIKQMQHPMYRLALSFLGYPQSPRTRAKRSWCAW